MNISTRRTSRIVAFLRRVGGFVAGPLRVVEMASPSIRANTPIDGSSGTDHLDLQRLRGKRIIHLLHIGKTGGTAVKEALKPYLSGESYEVVCHRHGTTLREIPDGDGVIFFLRDPISRFVSGFYSRQRKGRPRYNVPWSPGEAKAFRRFGTPNQLALALSSENDRKRRVAIESMGSIQHVRDSFWSWFDNESYFQSRIPAIEFIGFQETLDRDFEALKGRLHLPEEAVLPKDDQGSHKNPEVVDKRLDDEATINLKRGTRAITSFWTIADASSSPGRDALNDRTYWSSPPSSYGTDHRPGAQACGKECASSPRSEPWSPQRSDPQWVHFWRPTGKID